MAAERTRGTKTQSLSLRLDPKTKFILEFMARIKGQSITMVVERAIKDASADVVIDRDEFGNGFNWSDYWDPNEGVRTLKLLTAREYPTTFDEDELRAFTLAHWPFFYRDPEGKRPHASYLEIIWPSVGRYMETWREKKTANYWAAGEAMMADLSSAGIAPPDWPPMASEKSSSERQKPSGDLDDEIPF